jgi:hypothetical protein
MPSRPPQLKPVSHWFITIPARGTAEAVPRLQAHLRKAFPHLDFTIQASRSTAPNAGVAIGPDMGGTGGGWNDPSMRAKPPVEVGIAILDAVDDYLERQPR